ncbi:MAG TPA: class I SAM-dependent methyltransferase [Nitrospira sp.]|nr:class I SAM-dependent methyltransferase [Nitrospira sp.]
MDQSDLDLELEETRIKSVYAKRQESFQYSWFNQAHLFRVQELERRILAILRSMNLTHLQDKKILEIGCGQGQWLREFIKWGACPDNVTGIDILPARVSQARRLCPQGVQIYCGNAAKLSFGNASFDLVFQSAVFSSILDSEVKGMLAGEILRVLKDGGLILWYDFFFNNPSNSDVRGIRKREIAHLFPGCHIVFHRVSLAPPLSRLLAPYTWLGCYFLEQVQLFNTHYLAVIKRIS